MFFWNKSLMETERLILRRWNSNDFADFCEIFMDPDVTLNSGMNPIETKEVAKTTFTRLSKDKDAFAIVLKDENKAIGQIKFQEDFRRYKINSISIGYELAKAFWGKGYMPEALRAMVKYAFDILEVEIIGIAHFSINARSRRVIEKAGFHHEGTMRKAFRRFDGVELDDEMYSITREEYEANPELYKGIKV